MVTVIGAICKSCNALNAFDDEDVLKRETTLYMYGEDSLLCDESYIICANCEYDIRLSRSNMRPVERFIPPDTSPLPDPISVPAKDELQVPKR